MVTSSLTKVQKQFNKEKTGFFLTNGFGTTRHPHSWGGGKNHDLRYKDNLHKIN